MLCVIKEQESKILGAQEKIVELEYKIFQEIITEITKHRHLSVTIRNDLLWTDHIADILNKANK